MRCARSRSLADRSAGALSKAALLKQISSTAPASLSRKTFAIIVEGVTGAAAEPKLAANAAIAAIRSKIALQVLICIPSYHPETPSRTEHPIAMEPNLDKIEALVRQLLVELGEDPKREGLVSTPKRVAKALSFLTHGYRSNLDEVINKALFTQDTGGMVIVKDIELYSMCEHHMLPFFGRCHIGYIPDGKVFGVSKLARIVDMFARRLQLQERLTEQISRVVMEEVGAKGVGVMIEARHLCMMMRGVQKQNSTMVTSSVLGVFRDNLATREEFLTLIGKR
jgi:GTP cyclohydrolase I